MAKAEKKAAKGSRSAGKGDVKAAKAARRKQAPADAQETAGASAAPVNAKAAKAGGKASKRSASVSAAAPAANKSTAAKKTAGKGAAGKGAAAKKAAAKKPSAKKAAAGKSIAASPSTAAARGPASAPMSVASAKLSFMGWRRENGRVGVRNHVVILPLDDLSNAACEAVANNIKGTMALPHAYGRLQFGADLDLHFRTLIGTGSNPNVAAVVVIGIEDGWTSRVVEGIANTGKPVVGFGIEGHGDIATIAKASYEAKKLVQWASELQRERCDIAELWVSTKCGESDTTTGLSSCPTVGNMYDKLIPRGIYGVFGETSEITGAEHLAKARAATPEIGEKWYKMWKSYQDDVIEAHKTDDLSDSQPTKGNIAGGLTTIEEKALGNLEKIGHDSSYIDVLEPAEAPAKGPGLYYMDTSSAAAECVTLMAAGGYVVHTFPTGQGNVIGNPIVPVIKISGNPRTIRTMGEHIDLDVSGILRRDMTISDAGDALIAMIQRTANGRLTAAEALGHREFVMTKLYRSA